MAAHKTGGLFRQSLHSISQKKRICYKKSTKIQKKCLTPQTGSVIMDIRAVDFAGALPVHTYQEGD
uniref:Uncharacterized protein n=1 Tax=uncultured bacterium contig00081 TaxID=1181557 RepID=A0A806KQM8_9BACT|nr:hypothetical protein [uncultured bacterium contig00081]